MAKPAVVQNIDLTQAELRVVTRRVVLATNSRHRHKTISVNPCILIKSGNVKTNPERLYQVFIAILDHQLPGLCSHSSMHTL